jgi:hypothetical protein
MNLAGLLQIFAWKLNIHHRMFTDGYSIIWLTLRPGSFVLLKQFEADVSALCSTHLSSLSLLPFLAPTCPQGAHKP